MFQADLKAGMPKSVGGAEAVLLGDGVNPECKAGMTMVSQLPFEPGSGSLPSAGPLRTHWPVFRMLLAVFLVFNGVIFFAAVVDYSAWWPSESDLSP